MYITKFVISFSYSVFFVDKILNDSLYVNFYFIKNISPPPPPLPFESKSCGFERSL